MKPDLRYFVAWLMAIGFMSIIFFVIVEARDAFQIDGKRWFQFAMAFLAAQRLHHFSYGVLGKLVVVTEVRREP